MRRSSLCAALAALVLAPPAWAQTERPAPEVYALTNARIVVAPGRTIERGTVVIRDGRIQAVGAQVQPPRDAHRLDLSGLTVYPGLIDAASQVGMPRPRAQQGGPPGAAGGQATARSAEVEEIQPARTAAEVFTPRDADLEALRAAGITTVGLAFDGGILPGQTAVVSAGTGGRAALVVRSPVAMQAAFGTRRGQYPSTLMGSLAYLQQAFLDAAQQRRVEEAFRRDPASVQRPEYSPETRALIPAASRELPVWIAVARENDLKRAMELGRELNLDYTLLGAQEGYRIADQLARERRPVLVSLDFPRADALTGRAFELRVAPVSGEDRAAAEADSAAVREARSNAAALVRAGVPVALVSYGLDQPSEFRGRVRQAIEAGLAPEEALRALTVTPARVLGLERALGTVEAGKIANLVVVDGDLFSQDGRVRQVFVDGRRFEVREQPRAERSEGRPAPGAPAAPARVVIVGEWRGSATTSDGPISFTLHLEQPQGDQVAGELVGPQGSSPLIGEVTGNQISVKGQVPLAPGMPAVPFTLTGTIQGAEMRGTIDLEGVGSFPITAVRSPGGAS